jgi:signal transduction histidine kinase
VNEPLIEWDTSERQQVALDLQDSAIQMVVGNLLRFQALLTLLEKGRIEEAADLLRRTLATQRAVLGDLRRLMIRISPGTAS